MTAKTATDASPPVYYYFDEMTGNPGASDSGWITNSSYTDYGLSPSTTYTYRVRTKDSLGNTGLYSSTASATTQPGGDTDPPTGLSWITQPYRVTGSKAIAMEAYADDPSGVEFLFDETTGNTGGDDSGWQDSPIYIDDGLQEGLPYCYRVKARDKSPNQNETGYLTQVCVTVDQKPGIWQFAVISDSQGTDNGVNTAMLSEIASEIASQNVDFVLVSGDLVTGEVATQPLLESQFNNWVSTLKDQDFINAGIKVYPARGNHDSVENTFPEYTDAWINVFGNDIPDNGPTGEVDLTYSFEHNNALIIGLDEYVTSHQVNQGWLNGQLLANTKSHIFAFGHEPAFPGYHTTYSLNVNITARDNFWDSLRDNGVRTYFCGHDHFYNHASFDDDGDTSNDPHQYILGPAGGGLRTFSGTHADTTGYTVDNIYYSSARGYLLVTVSCLDVTITWMERTGTNTFNVKETWNYTVPGTPDTDAPTWDPTTWDSDPIATSTSTIEMTAPIALDDSGVEYFFENVTITDGSHDSGWQESQNYTDTGLSSGTSYTYKVKSRDRSCNLNETGWSQDRSATTPIPDTTPPNPNPAEWASVPTAAGPDSVTMTATTADDTDTGGNNPCEYYFKNDTIAGHDRGWDTSPSFTDSGLSSETSYTYRVQTRDAIGNTGDWSTAESATTPPAAPTGLTLTPISPTQIQMAWTDNAGNEEGFRIERKIGAGSYSELTTVPADITFYYDAGLDSSETYTYRLQAYNADGSSDWSNAASRSPLPHPPSGLTGIGSDGTVDLGWMENTESDFSYYNVYRSTTSGTGYTQIKTNHTTTQYTDSGLTNGITYYYVVKAVDTSLNESWPSNEAQIVPRDSDLPAAPTGLAASPDDQSVTLTWTANTESDLAGYNIYRSTTSGSGYSRVATGVIPPPEQYTDDGLINGITYYYVITAVDTSGNESPYSNEDNATPADSVAPSPPTNLHITAGDSTITLDWVDNTEEDLAIYTVYRSTTSGSGYTVVDSGLTSSEYTDTGLTNGTTYYYVLTAVDTSSNESDYSSEVSATPQDMTPPPAPTALVATAEEGQVILDWADNADPDDTYNVYRSTTPGNSYSLIASSLESSDYIDTAVVNGTTYYYVVTAVDVEGNESAYSDEVQAEPVDSTAPSKPTNLTQTITDAIQLNWDDNTETDLFCYKVYRDTISGFIPSNDNLIAANVFASEYIDDSASHDIDYYYMVKALDTSMNESIPSDEVAATFTGRVRNFIKDKWYYYLQDALEEAQNGDQIWVAAGTYKPDEGANQTPGDREATFKLKTGVHIYGGFPVGGGSWESRDWINNLTILSGDIDGDDELDDDNSNHVVTGADDAILDGFTIEGGFAMYGPEGGGMYNYMCSPIVRNCIFSENFSATYGGGMSNAVESNPTLINCIFRDNEGDLGGGMSNYLNSSPTVTNCIFAGNSAAFGGGMRNLLDSSPTVTNCVFSQNSADVGGGISSSGSPTLINCIFIGNSAIDNGLSGLGGGMNNYDSATLINCTFSGNSADGYGGGMFNENNSSATLTNCIFWDNNANGAGDEIYNAGDADTNVTYCDVKGGYAGTGNIGDDPLFVDPSNDDYRLSSTSPCINTGDPSFDYSGQVDLGGNRRVWADRVDMGAYELEGNIIYVNDDAPDTPHDGSDWDHAYLYLQDALDIAVAGDEIWVAEGTYYPDQGDSVTDDLQTETFQLISKVALYGGFPNGGSTFQQRDWALNKTILSGDIDVTGEPFDSGDPYLPEGENSFHVVKGADSALLDGFVIARGNANTGTIGGGGMLNDAASPTIKNCIFSANMSGDTQHGAGMYNCNSSSPTLINCIFSGNWTNSNGSAMYNDSSDPTLINCTITANYALGTAGGIYNESGNPTINNCIIWGNEDSSGTDTADAQIYIYGGSPVVTYSCITNWSGGGTGNIGTDPIFVSPGQWIATAPQDSKFLEVTIRDFIVDSAKGNEVPYHPTYDAHPNFEYTISGVEEGIVKDTLDPTDHKPDFTDDPTGLDSVTNETDFNRWYNDEPTYNKSETIVLELQHDGGGVYKFRDPWFFPIDHMLFGKKEGENFHYSDPSNSGDGHYHNFHFTLELHAEFYYNGETQFFEIYQSDDDMFIFIDGQLVVDIGGIHSPVARYLEIRDGDGLGGDAYLYEDETKTTQLKYVDLNLQDGIDYSFDLFYAERHTILSHLEFSTSIPLEQPDFEPGDYHLDEDSPCIDAADNDALWENIKKDFDCLLRHFDDPATEPDAGNGTKPIVDMGAYEYQFQVPPVAVDDTYSVYANQTLIVEADEGVLANDTDENQDTLIATKVDDVDYGTLTLSTDGSFQYIPDDYYTGDVTFTYEASDGQSTSNIATVTISVYPELVVDAGEPQVKYWPDNTVEPLDVTVEGGKPGAIIDYQWSEISTPQTGSVSFSNSTVKYPTVTLGLDPIIFNDDELDIFILKLRVNDGTVWADDILEITVLLDNVPGEHTAPQVDGGKYTYTVPDEEYLLTHPFLLDKVIVNDDGKPFNGFLSYEWSEKVVPLGPPSGRCIFSKIDNVDNKYVEKPYITFTQPGSPSSTVDYVLELKVSDGDKPGIGYAFIDIVVQAPVDSINHSPDVEAGGNTEIPTDPTEELVQVQLNTLSPPPSVYDADGDTLHYKWAAVGPPAGVTIVPQEGDSQAPNYSINPVATFTRPGTYVLTLTVNDGYHEIDQTHEVSDDVTIAINPLPEVEAGENKSVAATENTVTVDITDAWAKEHALPKGNMYLAWEWDSSANPSPPEGVSVTIVPATTYNPADIETTTVTIENTGGDGPEDIVGAYKLTLTATDDDLPSNPVSDEVWISVYRYIPGQAPTKKSVYIISDTRTNPSTMQAYEINGSDIIYQIDHILNTETEDIYGAISLALDPDTEILFVTFEGKNAVELVDAKEMKYVDTVTAPGAVDLAGIVYDSSRKKIYTIDRGSNRLYIYSWDPVRKILSLNIPPNSDDTFFLLNNCDNGYGLALDEANGRLYVADSAELMDVCLIPIPDEEGNLGIVRYYNIDEGMGNIGDYLGEYVVEDTSSQQKYDAIGIDVVNQYIYTSPGRPYFFCPGSEPPHVLCRCDISTGEILVGTVGSGQDTSIALGISADQETGLLYLTTCYSNYSNDQTPFDEPYPHDRLLVYDARNDLTSNWSIDSNSDDVGNPTDVVVGETVTYKYPMGTEPAPAVTVTAERENCSCGKLGGICTCLVSPLDAGRNGITYTITYHIRDDLVGLATETIVTYYLPKAVDYVSASHQRIYDPNTRTVSWYLGDVSAGENNEGADEAFELNVNVNKYAKPGGSITNLCEIESDTRFSSADPSQSLMNVDLWCEGNIIYVNQNGQDGGGTSWETSYKYLDEAIACAENYVFESIWPNGGQIWVAAGTYRAETTEDKKFILVEGVDVYGGFKGNETSIEQRNLTSPASKTIMQGFKYGYYDHEGDYVQINIDRVIEAADNSTLDGFTIRGGYTAAILIYNCSPTISNCIVKESLGDGIYCEAASPTIADCVIEYNDEDGIHCVGGSPKINSNIIRYNDNKSSYKAGIHLEETEGAVITNDFICDNGIELYGVGIYLHNCNGSTTIRNNTIVNNDYGIWRTAGAEPTISNCIIWNNFNDNLNETYNNITYSCVQGEDFGDVPDHPENPDDNYNFEDDPEFKDGLEHGDYHLQPTSPCISNPGDSTGISDDETDIDGEPRIVGGTVDIGADEYPPFKVFAGTYREETLPISPASVDIFIDNASLTHNDIQEIPDNLKVEWTLVEAPPGEGDIWNGQQNVVRPTLSLTKCGDYLLKLTAYDNVDQDADLEPEEVVGSDFLRIKVYLGVRALSDPDVVELPDNKVTLSVEFTEGLESEVYQIYWAGHPLVTSLDKEMPMSKTESVNARLLAGLGIYYFKVYALNANGFPIGQDTIPIPLTHQLIDVDAGDEQTITWPKNKVYLHGIVPDMKPDMYTKWEISEKAEEFVKINDVYNLETFVTFEQPGYYEIGLVVYDEIYGPIGSDKVAITVNPPNYSMLEVDAGEDQKIVLPTNSVILSGFVKGGTYDSVEWIVPPGSPVTFSSKYELLTKATFGDPGISGKYDVGLVAKSPEGDIIGVDVVTVWVYLEDQVVVDAGEDQTILWSPGGVTVDLSGEIINSPEEVDVEWFDPSETTDDLITFGNQEPEDAQKLETTATIQQPSEYHIPLVAKVSGGDDILAIDTVTITVDFHQVLVDAGPDQEITNYPYQDSVALHGTILEGTPESIEWVFPDSILAENHGPENQPDSWVQFPEPGVYIIGFAAKNGTEVVGWDTMTVTVNSEYDIDVDLTSTADTIRLTGNPAVDAVGLTATVTGGHISLVDSVEWHYLNPSATDIYHEMPFEDQSGYNPHNANVKFYKPGIYDIAFLVKDTDGNVIGSDKITITAQPEIQMGLNVTASSDVYELIWPDNTAQLDAVVTGLTDEWIGWFDPSDSVLFTPFPPEQQSVTAVFSDPGVYHLTFFVKNDGPTGQVVGFDTVTIVVSGYQSGVTVEAGETQEVELSPTGTVTVSLEGNISGVYFESLWVDPTGNQDRFGDPAALKTDATFDAPTVYELALLALDEGGDVLEMDTVFIDVKDYDNQMLIIEAVADPETITYTIDEYTQLTATLKGDFSFVDRVEWADLGESGKVHFDDPWNTQTKARFDEPGYYTLVIKALYGASDIVGWDTVSVTVNDPKVYITAKAKEQSAPAGDYVEEYYALFTGTHTISLDAEISGLGIPAVMSYEWSEVETYDHLTITDPASKDTTAEITEPGIYLLKLEVKEVTETIGRDTIKIVLQSDVPMVGTGQNYPTVEVGETLHLDKAYIYDDQAIIEGNISWESSDPTNTNFNYTGIYSKTKPGVTFYADGPYILTLSYNDGVNQVDSLVKILVLADSYFIYAGSEKTTIPYYPVQLDDAVANPPSSDLTYSWTVTSGEVDAVQFAPSASVLQPKVLFKTIGPFTLTLTVEKDDEIVGVSNVNIDVKQSPIPDTESPLIDLDVVATVGAGPVPELIDPEDIDVHGTMEITVRAADENIADVTLKIKQDGKDDLLFYPDIYQVSAGTLTHPTELILTYNVDTYYSGYITVEAKAFDRTGTNPPGTDSLSFTSIHEIQSFEVSGVPITSTSQTLNFTGTLSSEVGWDVYVYQSDDIGGTQQGHQSGTGNPVNGSIDGSGWTDGHYAAQLVTASGDSALVYFNVIKSAQMNAPIAEITDPYLQNGEDYDEENNVQSNPLPKITEGLFNLQGTATHPVFHEDVYYKIEIYDPRIKSYEFDYDLEGNLYYLYENWKNYPQFFIKNVTPDRAGDGYYHGYVYDGILGKLDFSNLENGIYRLLLTVELRLQDATYVSYDSVEFVLDCPLKVGNLKFSQEDMVVPVSGYPLRVIRSYDSLRKHKHGDFGYGWALELVDLDVELNEERYGTGDNSIRFGGDFDRDVTLTLPDGRRVTFISTLSEPYSISGGQAWDVLYLSPEGGDDTLTTLKNDRVIWGMGLGYFWDDSGADYRPWASYITVDLSLHDISEWILKTADGTQYYIKRTSETKMIGDSDTGYEFQCCGKPYLHSIETPSGKTIEISSVFTITRDSHNRITQISGPSGLPSITYDYDPYGNLESVSKLVNSTTGQYETTYFFYDDLTHHPTDHFVTDIQDPRGLTPIRYIYDDDNRLVGVYDAKDNYINIQHNIEGDKKTETVIDRAGNVTVYTYNERGNVTQVDKIYHEDLTEKHYYTLYEYDEESDHPDSPIKVRTQLNPNADPDAQPFIEDDWSTTEYRYDSDGRPLVTIDPMSNVTTNTYDAFGSVIETTQWRPNIATPASFPDDYLTNPPADYDEVSTTFNTYIINLLKTTEVSQGGVIEDMSVNLYDTENRIEHVIKIDVENVTDFGLIYTLSSVSNLSSIPGNHIVTTYFYDEAASNSDDQPYKISEPYYDNGSAVFNRFFKYDDRSNQTQSWTTWEDPYDGDSTIDRYVFTIPDYDPQGRVIQTRRVVDDDSVPSADTISDIILSQTAYNSIGKVDYTINEHSILTKYFYDETGNLVETSVYESAADYLTILDNGKLAKYIDGIGYSEFDTFADFDFDVDTTLLTTSRTLYDKEGRTLVSVGPYDGTIQPVGTENIYDQFGRVVETRRWANVSITLVYFWFDAGQMVESENMVAGYEPIGKKAPAGITVANAWEDAAQPPPGLDIGWRSDSKLPVTDTALAATYPDDYINEFSFSVTEYDTAGRVYRTYALDEAGDQHCTAEYDYDEAGKQIMLISLPGSINETIALTDYLGTRRWKVTDARSNTTEFTYDTLGRIIMTEHPPVDVDGIDQPEPDGDGDTEDDITYTHVYYDGLGRKIKQSAPVTEGNASNVFADELREFQYDATGRLVHVTLPQVDNPENSYNPENPIYYYFYDDHGNLVGIWDSKFRLTVFKYNEQNRQTHRYMPFEHIAEEMSVDVIYTIDLTDIDYEFKEYDDFGRIYKETNFKDQLTVYSYNTRGLLEYKRHYATIGDYDELNPTYNADPEIYYIYDTLGRKENVITTTYDSGGAVIGTPCQTDYYDDDEGRIIVVASEEGYIRYIYNLVTGRKTETRTYDLTADLNSDVLAASDNDITRIEYTYHKLGRLDTVTTVKRNGDPVSEETTYSYNEVGSRAGLELPNGAYADYSYDAQNRLKELKNYESKPDPVTNPDPPTLSTFAYTLAADGMRTTAAETLKLTGGTTETPNITYTYDNLNRLLIESADDGSNDYIGTYKYDLAGNRKGDGTTHKGRKIETNNGTLETEYVYYTGTDRLWKEIHDGPVYSFIIDDQQIYAYASNGQITYRYADTDEPIGMLKAYILGLPTKLSQYLFRTVMALVLLVFFAPAFVALVNRIRKRSEKCRKQRLSLFYRCLSVLLAYVMLISPVGFQTLAKADSQYANIETFNWAEGNQTIEYTYDDNGSVLTKITKVTSTQAVIEKVEYDYNLQNRLEKQTVKDAGDVVQSWTEYTYNENGIRVKSVHFDSTDTTTTLYLIDAYNHTGYAQVIEESTYDMANPDPSIDIPDSIMFYTIGDDVISQTEAEYDTGWTVYDTEHLLYDGHGSTRQLSIYDATPGVEKAVVTDVYNYDAYGVAVGFDPSASPTSMLYAGEYYDNNMSNYYLRARWYSPATGRFNRMDPFAGNNRYPQSLHKYLYVHNNPVNGIDPTGMMEFSLTGVLSAIQITGTIMSVAMPSLITLGAAGNLGAVLDTPPDAFVVSVSASYIFKSLGKGFGGMGLEGTYEMLYINALGRWQDYGSIGWTAGSTGGSVTLEAGPVWNVKKVEDYENLFFSATYGGAPFDLKFPGLSQGGMGVTVFWSPMGAKARGFKMGPIASTGMLTGSGTISFYKAGGPFSMGKDIAKWFNDNIPAPNLINTQSVDNLINAVKEKLNPLP